MQFDFGLHVVTGMGIDGSDRFGDTQSVVKSLTTIWNSFRNTGDAHWQGKQPFRKKMSGFGTNVRNSGHMSRVLRT